jgi:hypothetical protein
LVSRGFDLPVSEMASVILPRGRCGAVSKLAGVFEWELGLQATWSIRAVE